MADNSGPFPKLGSAYETSSQQGNQLSHYLGDMSVNSARDPDRKVNSWDAQSGIPSNPWVSQTSAPNTWGHPHGIQKLGIQSSGGSGMANDNSGPTKNGVSDDNDGNAWPQQTNEAWGSNCLASQHVVSPPLDNRWQWSSEAASTQSKSQDYGYIKDEIISNPQSGDVGGDKNGVSDDSDDESDVLYNSDDDFLDDDSDSDTSQKSHEAHKKSKWFKAFFETLDTLTVEEIDSPSRQWHCPACRGGPGAIDWYQGVQPLIVHAKAKKTRAKLHREFAALLDEEIFRRGASVAPVGEAFGRWEGLTETVKDHEIVWPPMVIIMNTRYEQDETGKWIGMGNQELRDYFNKYAAMKAGQSYGPKGHRGMSVLIFKSSAAGYIEAARLHKHFKEQERDREAWDRSRVSFGPGGNRKLYGYMAVKEDLDIFNRHSQGKCKLNFEMRSYHQMVESQLTQITDYSHQLIQLANMVVKEQKHLQVLAESLGRVSEKLRQTTKENRIVRGRTKLQHEQNKEEIDALERFFKDQIKIIQQEMDTKEDIFEKLQQAEQEKVEQLTANPSVVDDGHRTEEIAEFIKLQEMGEFETKREKLIRNHQDKKVVTMQRYWKERLELEKEFEEELTQLMDKYTEDCLKEKRGKGKEIEEEDETSS